jgi:16S rRNA (guanine527-N7)-methyltransferase
MDPGAARALAEGAAHFGLSVDGATRERLGRYLETLRLWGRRTRLTAEREEAAVVRKHVVDSLAVMPLLPARGLVVDVGSGAGFPGVVIACVRPDLEVMLVDSRRRRVSFLRDAIRAAGLARATAVEARAEDLGQRPDVAGVAAAVTARAVRLDAFLALAAPLVAFPGRIIAMQTPDTAAGAAQAAAAQGLMVQDVRAYSLPAGERRALVVCVRFPGKRDSAS